jgi:predicted DNA-binding protein YlxM (UPF0122 family)
MNTHKLTVVTNLCDLLEKKLEAFQDFLSLTLSLKEISETNDMDQIGKLLKKRDHYINAIDEIDGRIDTLESNTSSIASMVSDEIREKIDVIIQAIKKTAEKAQSLTTEIEAPLVIQHDTVRRQLLTTNHARDGVKGYILKEYGKNQPRFLDTKL